ncbi:MAG TPA: ribonuclease III [Acidiferrobacterales bacterium]|nr:ribonuclease III [Acidiferrobacterales bacterium]
MSSTHNELARRLGYAFRDAALLARALTHRSRSSRNYERLEFLGDSILSFVIADVLYDRFPQLSEGELTRLRATLVRRETLATLARELDLGDCLELGGGELKSGGFDRDSILADALEAVFGAVYKDGGIEAVREVVLHRYQSILSGIDPNTILKDPKTRLQEFLQHKSLATPIYNVLEVSGEPHQQRFVVECRVPGLTQGVRGEGSSRRYAEQAAATRACELLNCEADD